MKTPNVGEYGIAYDVNVNYDLSAAAKVRMDIKRPDGTVIGGDAVVGLVDLVTESMGTFQAKKYCTYTFKDGDLNQVGDYIARVIYTDSTKRLIADPVGFSVNP